MIVSCDNLHIVHKYLREQNIHVRVDYLLNIRKWNFSVFDLRLNGDMYIQYIREYDKLHKNRRFDTYEQALEAGLNEALENSLNKVI